MAAYRLKVLNKECPICGKMIYYNIGDDRADVIYIKTKRGTQDVYHRDCYDKLLNTFRGERYADHNL